MSTLTRWNWGAAAFVIAAFALLGGAHLCGAARDVGARPLAEGGLACAEFWLNRYQTFLGALAALLAGYAAWRGAMSQVARSDAQIHILSQQAAMDRVDYINTKLGPIDSLYTSLNAVQSWGNDAISKIPRLFMHAADISVAATHEDWSHQKIYDKLYAPLHKDFIEELVVVSRNIESILHLQNEAALPEDVRNGLPRTTQELVRYYESIMKFKEVFSPRLSITSSFDAVNSEYYRISHNETDVPDPIDINKFDIFEIVAQHRDRLLSLRNRAFAVAEA